MNELATRLAASTCLAMAAGSVLAQDAQKVFFLLPNSTTIRFESRDAPFFVESLKQYAPDAEVIVQNGEGDPARQQRLVEDAIAQGADVILYTSSDANLAAGSLAAAEEAGVPVVLYDHDAVGGRAEAHVVFDSLRLVRRRVPARQNLSARWTRMWSGLPGSKAIRASLAPVSTKPVRMNSSSR